MPDTYPQKIRESRISRVSKTCAYYVHGAYAYFDKHPIYLLAGGIAFNALLCVVPVVLFLFYGLGLWLERQSILDVVDTQLKTFIPEQVYRMDILNALRAQIDLVVKTGRIAGIIGILGSIWTGSTLFASARTALNGIYGFQAKRIFIIYKLRDILMLLVLGILVIVAVVIAPLSEVAVRYGRSFFAPFLFQWVSGTFPIAISIISSFLLFFILYRSLSHHHIESRSALAGALTATILWECAKKLFAFYLTKFTALGILYGTYTFLVIAALWTYYSAVVFILGGVITRLHWERSGKNVGV